MQYFAAHICCSDISHAHDSLTTTWGPFGFHAPSQSGEGDSAVVCTGPEEIFQLFKQLIAIQHNKTAALTNAKTYCAH